jgi:hypothetical protein
MHKQRKYILIASAVGIIALFLPWTTVSVGIFGVSNSESTNGFHSYGIAVFFAFAATGVVAFLGEKEKQLSQNMWLAALAGGAVALLFSLIFWVAGSGTYANYGFVEAHRGVGAWIAPLAAAGIVAFTWMLKKPTDNLKQSLESITKSLSSAQAKPIVPEAVSANKLTELERLVKLKEQGNISEEEYQSLKSKLV